MQKIDFNDVLKQAGLSSNDPASTPVLKEVNKLNAIMGILSFLGIDVKALIAALIQKVLRGKQEVPVAKPPVAATAPSPTPTPGPTAPSPGPVREITSFGLVPFWFKENNESELVRKDSGKFDAVIHNGDGSGDPLGERNSLMFDAPIFDQFGQPWHIQHGSQEAVDQLWWPKDGGPDADTQRMRWFFDGGDGIAEIHDNADGFNPRIHIAKGALKEKGRDYQTGQLFGRFTRKDGVRIETPRYPSLRAKR